MDDQQKIKAIMVYYNHWGRDEINARKILHGLRLTTSLLVKEYVHSGMSLYESLTSLFYNYSEEHVSNLCKDLIDLLLRDCGEFYNDDWMISDEIYSMDDHLFDRKCLFESNSGDLGKESSRFFYSDNFDYRNVLSVESIVALKPLHLDRTRHSDERITSLSFS